ncbi:MAG: GNAT family N-acetyltransferase [Desulfobacteraceae bacterium]|nr:GNAT family N-acetyltransferase [Desulfobacteraceae bacterium]
MKLSLKQSCVRSWRRTDAQALARHANNRNIWLNLRDLFPHPYTLADAETYIDSALSDEVSTRFCIEVNGEAAGSIGFILQSDVERLSAEIGYFLGESFWGRGIMSEVLKAVTTYAIETHGLVRVYAVPYAWNPASCRVLEKAGYTLEGRLRKSIIKDGKKTDQHLYARVV